MDVDEAAADGPSDDVRESKNPLEKMRVRLAAENYNKPNSYQTMPDDSDDEHTTGLYTALCLKYCNLCIYKTSNYFDNILD